MKKAIVIGASSGIGRALARRLAREGYRLGIAARRVEVLRALRDELAAGVRVKRIDVAEEAAARAALSELMTELGGVDLVVIGAGSGDVNHDLTWDIERQTINTNITGFAAMANVALKHFVDNRSGHLVGISSIAALRGGRASPAYNASKAFVSNYLEGLRQKVTHLKLPITVTDVKPGFVATAMAKGEGLFWVASPDKAAARIFSAIKAKRSHVYVTRRWRLIGWLLKAMPQAIYRRL